MFGEDGAELMDILIWAMDKVESADPVQSDKYMYKTPHYSRIKTSYRCPTGGLQDDKASWLKQDRSGITDQTLFLTLQGQRA